MSPIKSFHLTHHLPSYRAAQLPDPKTTIGQFYPPTVLLGVRRGMKIWEEEVFGPVMIVVPFDTDDEVIALANDCDFGLGSNVFSGSQARSVLVQ